MTLSHHVLNMNLTWEAVGEQIEAMNVALSHDRTPTLADLIKLWCEELSPRMVEAAAFYKIDLRKEWFIFKLGERHIAYIYDDFIIMIGQYDGGSDWQRVYAAEPDFFERLGRHVLLRIKDPRPLEQLTISLP